MVLCWLATGPASAGDGPGLGNLSYQPGELFQPISLIESGFFNGHGNAAMVNGYLLVIYSIDGGGLSGNGGFDVFDVSDPRHPVRVVRLENADTHQLREPHGFSLARIAGRDVLATQGVEGISFWDVTDPLAIQLLSHLDLPDISQGDYSGDWWLFWQAPYVYVAGTESGLFVVDARDPSAPTLAGRVATGDVGGLTVGQVFAVGNLLLVAKNGGPGAASLDASDPLRPSLIERFPVDTGYSHLFAAGLVLTSGDGAPRELVVHRVDEAGGFEFVGRTGDLGLSKGGYGSYQDGIFHGGFSKQYAKFDIESLALLGTGTSGVTQRDEDFATVLGNLVFVGDDHAVGSALIAHQTAPDTTGPEVTWVHPADGADGLATTSRVGVSMSDHIDLDSVDATSFVVRPVGGEGLPGTYSVQMGLVNFTPATPLAPDREYEVVVDGLADWAGNRGGRHTSRFHTGSDARPGCRLGPLEPVEVGGDAQLSAAALFGTGAIQTRWDLGNGGVAEGESVSHRYTRSGRFPVVLHVENALGEGRCSGVQIVHRPLTEMAPAASSPIAEADGWVWTVNPDNDSVTAIDAVDLDVQLEVPVGDEPRSLAPAPTGDIWVANRGDASIHVISPSGTTQAVHALPPASRPGAIVFAPDGRGPFVTLEGLGDLVELDGAGQILRRVALGPRPRAIAVSGDSQRGFVTRFVSPDAHGVVYEVDLASFTRLGEIPLAFDPGPDSESSGRGVPNYLNALAVRPDGARIAIPSKKDNTARGEFRDGERLTFESRVRTIVSQIDLVDGQEDLAARIDIDDRDMAQAVLWTPLGDLFLVALQGSNRVEIFDAETGGRIGGLGTGRAPQGLAWNADATRLFVHDFLGRSVSVYDSSGLVAGVSNGAPALASVPTVRDERLAPDVLAGKRIFYNAADSRMNRDGYLTCASCHLDGGSDGRVWDFTQVGEGLRNTIDLRGRAGLGHGFVHWTANFDEIQDFENDIRSAFSGQGFLGFFDFFVAGDPLGTPKAGRSTELDRLAAYVSSLDRTPESPYREPDGGLGPAARLGRLVFVELGCPGCHAGARFTDAERHDVGTIGTGSGLGIGEPLEGVGFETPTLKGLWLTPPFLHDGSAASLDAVLANAVHMGRPLDAGTRDLLVAYLMSLDDREIPPECSDGIDNDGDLATDHPDDPECLGTAGLSESVAPGCGLGPELGLLLSALAGARRRRPRIRRV